MQVMAVGLLALVLSGSAPAQVTAVQGSVPASTTTPPTHPLTSPMIRTKSEPATGADWNMRLLQDAAVISAMLPTPVHARDKAKLQEKVGLAYLARGDFAKAEDMARTIDGWRRATLFAAVALEHAKAGRADDARRVVRIAVAASTLGNDWQRQRAQVMAARVYAWLGEDAEASRLETGVGEPDMGKVAAARAERARRSTFSAEAFDAQMVALDEWLATRNFDLVRNAVDIALEYHPAAFADAVRRARVEELVQKANEQLAYDLRIANLLRLAANCEQAGDRAAATAFIAKAEATFGVGKWLAEDAAVQLALIAQAKSRSGDAEGCAANLAAALARYDAGRNDIIDIDRGRPLRAIAEAYATAGDAAKAQAVFARAVEEGAVNPNARPRAEDLVATMLSMVAVQIEPEAALAARMTAIREGLVAPW